MFKLRNNCRRVVGQFPSTQSSVRLYSQQQHSGAMLHYGDAQCFNKVHVHCTVAAKVHKCACTIEGTVVTAQVLRVVAFTSTGSGTVVVVTL